MHILYEYKNKLVSPHFNARHILVSDASCPGTFSKWRTGDPCPLPNLGHLMCSTDQIRWLGHTLPTTIGWLIHPALPCRCTVEVTAIHINQTKANQYVSIKSHGYIATHYFFLLVIKSLKSDRRTSKVCSFVTLFFKIFEATVKLLRLEVLWPVFIITEKWP